MGSGGIGGGSSSKSSPSSSKSSTPEDPLKALDDLYNAKLALSKQYIEDRNFYEDWDKYSDNEIDALNRIKALHTRLLPSKVKCLLNYMHLQFVRLINQSILHKKALLEKQKADLEKVYKGMQSASTKQLDRERKSLEDELKSDNAYYDRKIQRIQDQISALDEQADKEDRLLAIEKARIELAKTQSQKSARIYKAGIGFVWETDQKAVSDAQSNLDGLITELE